jgi:hypothetical protein
MPQAIQNLASEVWMQDASSAEIALTLGTHANRQVAGSSSSMLHFSVCGDAKTFLRRLMCLHFWHVLVIPFLI